MRGPEPPMLDFGILFSAVLNGLTTGAVYALVALGLTLIYGVLHIINFAHGAALMLALYAVYLLKEKLGHRSLPGPRCRGARHVRARLPAAARW